MDDRTAGKLQIYSVEERGNGAATCVVRCVGGVVRTGQRFGAVPDADEAEAARGLLVLHRITRYEKDMDFIDPPHSATVRLLGDGVDFLKKGVILTAADDE
ncbi:hypothetical protein [Streptomyces sp. NBC_01423]|uniref:hypothetical protein n=1 Tax=Streptomyces sp. NBC_01423 TaxID=2903860 RepID=UPI002E2E1299|nr:hypothetical protein [Streptomyces sp. NBC_01423]